MSAYAVPVYDTSPLTAALRNPYAPHDIHHAYMQAHSTRTTPQGYSLSSTYVPGNQTSRPPPQHRPSVQPTPVKRITNHLTCGNWYQPGNCRCTRQACPFTGSPKSLEIHMMDRHFIFPPRWQKSKDEWDADPSLKGKPVAILGTSLVLNTPEAIDAWIAERKRRFPSDKKIQDKKRKLEEAAARGQLTPEDMGVSAWKKYRQNSTFAEGANKGSRGQRCRGGRGRRWQVQRDIPRAQIVDDSTTQPPDGIPKCSRDESSDSGPADDDDAAPEVVSSKAPILPNVDGRDNHEVHVPHAYPQGHARGVSQPKKLPRNPFASRPTLLRNLLLPEIRVTVSNLSQAIRFLVDNDFLRDVEVRPGEAQENLIQVLGSGETANDSSQLSMERHIFNPSDGL